MGERNRRRATLLAAFALYPVLPNAAAAGESVCDPEPETEVVLRQLRQIDETCNEVDRCRQQKGKVLEQALARRQWDVFLHREHQDLLRPRPQDSAKAVGEFVERYESRKRREPGRPLWLYLFGRALLLARREARPELFERALEHDSGFAWAHMALVSVYVGNPTFEDAAKGQKHIDAFVRLCPDSPEIYASMADDTPFERTGLAGLRALLERRPDTRTLPYFEKLWRAEFRVTPPGEHETVRARVRADIEHLRASSLQEKPEWWETAALAHQLVGDEAGRLAVEREMVARFPCRDKAAWLRQDHWDREHPEPEAPEGRAAQTRSWYEAASAWAKECPETFAYLWARFTSATLLEGLPNEELSTIVGDLLVSWERSNRQGPSPYFTAARALLERGLWLERIDELSRKGLEEAEASRARSAASPGLSSASLAQIEKGYQRSEWQAHALRAHSALERKESAGVARLLVTMEALLDKLHPTQDDARGYKRWYRSARGDYWALKAKLAVAQGRHPDAFAFYRKALPDRPEDAALREAARRLWTQTGGTEEGWSAWAVDEGGRYFEAAAGVRDWEATMRPVPDFDLRDVSGRKWTRADVAGRATFVNVWTTWCGPCLLELPYIQKLHERLKDRADVVLLTLNVDDNPGVVGPYLEQNSYCFPALLAADWFQENRADRSIPQNWLVDPAGVVRFEQVGFAPNEGARWVEDVLARITDLAKSKPGTDPPER